MCIIVPSDLMILADTEQQVCPGVILKQQRSAAVQQTLIHLLGESSIARTILWDSLLACWMTRPTDSLSTNFFCQILVYNKIIIIKNETLLYRAGDYCITGNKNYMYNVTCMYMY